MDERYKLLESFLGKERIRKNEPLSDYVYTKTDALAQYFFVATSAKEIGQILDMTDELRLPFTLIGGGTKTLIPENGLAGVVIKNRSSNIKIAGVKGKIGKGVVGVDEALFEVDSGVSIGKLKEFLAKQGFEFSSLSFRHSSIGGSIFVDKELCQHIVRIKVWTSGEIMDIPLEDLRIKKHVVITVMFKFKVLK